MSSSLTDLVSPLWSWPVSFSSSENAPEHSAITQAGRLLVQGLAQDAFDICDASIAAISSDGIEPSGDSKLFLSGLFVLRALCCSRIGLQQECMDDLDLALSFDPNNTDALNTRAMQRLDSGNIDGAFSDIDRAIAVSPDSPRLYSTRSAIHVTYGDICAARKDCDTIVLLDPEMADAYANRAVCNCLDHPASPSLALRDINTGISHDPGNASLYRVRAGVMLLLDRIDDALADLDQAVTLRPSDMTLRKKRGDLHKRNHDLTAALEDFTTVLEHQPDDENTLRQRAEVFAGLERWQECIQDLRHLLLSCPECPELWSCLSRAQFHFKEFEKCIESAEHSLSLADPSDKDARDDARYLANSCLGMVAICRSRYEDGARYFTEALRYDGSAVPARANRAACFANLNKHKEAICDLNKAIKGEPLPACYLERGRCRDALGQTDAALSDFSEAITLDPFCCDAFFTRALLYSRLNRTEEAITDCNAAIKIDPKHQPSLKLRDQILAPERILPPSAKRLRSQRDVFDRENQQPNPELR